MSFTGSGTFVINSTGQPIVTSTVISSTMMNALTADLATGLSNCITKDGQQTVIANVPFGGFKLTGVGLATVTGDALSYGRNATVAALTATGTTTLATSLNGFLGATSGVVSAITSISTNFTFAAGLTITGSAKMNIIAMAAVDIDVSAGECFTKSISGNTTFTISNPTASKCQGFILDLTISSSPTITWPASVKWSGGVAASFGNGRNIIGMITTDGGTSWIGVPVASAVA